MVSMKTVTINFTIVGTRKKSTFYVKVKSSAHIKDVKHHVKASKGIVGKILQNNAELSDETTLAEAGTVLDMESYTPPKLFKHKIAVKRLTGEVINVQVHSGTVFADLKHKIQDETGIPVDKQILEYRSRPLNPDKRVVEVCVHSSTHIILKLRMPLDPRDTELIQMVPDTDLSDPELDQIASKIVDWYHLAIQLGISIQAREAIEKDYKYKRQKTEMLLEWKRSNASKATWKALIRASLRAENAGRQLAEDIVKIWRLTQAQNSTPVNATEFIRQNSSPFSRSQCGSAGVRTKSPD